MSKDDCNVKIGRLTRLLMGYVGEASTREIRIDLGEWWAEYPDALIAIQVLRPQDHYKYFAAYERVGDVAVWTISSGEVKYAGKGIAQVTLYNPDTHQEYKSRVVETIVTGSVDEFNAFQLEEDDPAQKWVNQTLEAASDAQKAAKDASDAADNAQVSAEEAKQAASDVDNKANQYAMLGGYYTVTMDETTFTINTSSGFARVLAGNKWTPVTADKYEFAQPAGYNHAVIVFDDETGEFAISPASTYTGGKNAHQTAVGVVYWDANGNITKYHINGEVTDKATNQFGMLGGLYTVTVSDTEVTIDASSNLMRVLMGNKWQYIDAEVYTFGKPDNVNHGVIFCKNGRFDLSAASNYVDTKTADKVAVGVVYWDANGKITKYHINGQVTNEAVEALTSYPQGTLSGDYSVTIENDEIYIDTSSGFARVLCNGQYTTPTAGVYALAKQDVYHHYVIVYKGGGFELQAVSVYSGAADADAVCVGVAYFGEDGTLETYHINGEVTDKVADEEAEIAMREAANQFGMIGGNYTITVGTDTVTIDATGSIMRVLAGNAWQTVTPAIYTLTKPEGINHGIIYFEGGAFGVAGGSAYTQSKTADKVAVGIVYWDTSGKVVRYEINGKVNDQRGPGVGGSITRDVRLFGAMGDGVTDDTDAIQAALDECKNGILYFPNGNYMITRTLYIHSNTHIMGNKGYTAIKLLPQEANELDELEWRPEDGRNKFPAVRTDDDSTGCIIEGIVFEGDSTYFHDLQQNGLYITGSHHVIRDCQFINWNYFPDKWEGRKENASAWGLAICHATHIKVEDCYCNKNGYEGAGTEFAYGVDFRGCYFGAAMRTGLQIHRASVRISLEGCVLNNNVDSDNPLGDYATMTFHGAEGALIDGVKIVNCDFRHRHIQCVMGYERNVQISNCRVYSDSGYFVVITMGGSGVISQNEGWQIIGNEFFSTKSDGNTAIGMNVDKSIVSDNILHTNAETPIAMVGTANHAADNLIIRIVSSGTPESYVYPAVSGGGSEYTLPTASAETKGGVKVGSGLQMNGEVLSAKREKYELIETITPEETITITRTEEPDGTPYNFTTIALRAKKPEGVTLSGAITIAAYITSQMVLPLYLPAPSATTEQWCYCEVRQNRGLWERERAAQWGALNSTATPMYVRMPSFDMPVTEGVNVFKATGTIPAGVTIEIWGCRA